MLYEWWNVSRSDGFSPAQLLFGVINDIKNQQIVEEYIAKNGHPGSFTAAPPSVIADEADLSVNTQTTNEDTNINQSNNGISFINLY